ncbi:MAG: glycosyltransferase family 87 protein [Anaerolineales bacterium]
MLIRNKLENLWTHRVRAILFFCLLAILAGNYFIQFKVTQDTDVAVDFPSFYYASKLVFENDLTPYNKSNWRVVKPLYTDGDLSPFLYPPPSLLIFRPFILFDYATAKSHMLWLNHILILLFVFVFFFKILKLRPQDGFLIAAVIYLYAFFPLRATLNNGQVSLWVLLSICLTWWAVKEKAHPIWIALPLVFGIIVKLYPIVLLIPFFFRREYRAIKYVLIVLVAASAIATLVLPNGIWQDWYTEVASQGYVQEIRGMMIARPANQSINAFTTRLFYGLNVRFDRLLPPPSWAGVVPYILAGFVGLTSQGASWWISQNKVREPDNLNLHFCVWSLVMFLVSPLSWNYQLVHVLPVIYIAVLEALKGRNWLVLTLIIGIALLLAYDFPFNYPFFRNGGWTLLISSQLYAIGLLWIYFIFMAYKKGKNQQQIKAAL